MMDFISVIFQYTSKTSQEEGHVFDKHTYILKY